MEIKYFYRLGSDKFELNLMFIVEQRRVDQKIEGFAFLAHPNSLILIYLFIYLFAFLCFIVLPTQSFTRERQLIVVET